jgi:uncharacterized protein
MSWVRCSSTSLTVPEAPTRAALGLLVARSAVEAGHEVSVFFAGDAAYLVKDEVIASLAGIGTGRLAEHLPALVEAGVPMYVSGMSSQARGVTAADLEGKGTGVRRSRQAGGADVRRRQGPLLLTETPT